MVVALFFDFKQSLGIALGCLFGIVELLFLEQTITNFLKLRRKGGWYFRFLLNFILLLLPFIFVVLFPNYLGFIGVAIGLILNKVVIYMMNWTRKE